MADALVVFPAFFFAQQPRPGSGLGRFHFVPTTGGDDLDRRGPISGGYDTYPTAPAEFVWELKGTRA
jgi:hypothetical protein